MELALSLGDSQAVARTFPTRNLNLGLWLPPETAIESRGQELHNQSDSNDLPLRLGLKWTSQSLTTEPVMSPGSGEASVTSRGSDDEENGLPSSSRKKLRLSKDQYVYLEESFEKHQNLNPKQKGVLAKELGLRPRQVEVWFQNRRARTKMKQTEVDCAYLRRCCDTLMAENRRLHKELADLRALKAAGPFYMQLPTTTLSLSHSCERISATSVGGDNRKNAPFAALLNSRGFFPLAGPSSHQPSAAKGACPKMALCKNG